MPTEQRQCAISVDLDAIRYYRAIHGLRNHESRSDAWLALAVERLAQFAKTQNIPITWFVVVRDLDSDEQLADLLLGLCRRGHEIANHSLDHYYDLTRRGHDVMRAQVFDAAERLTRLTGKTKHGFRAPGYTITAELAQVLQEVGVSYDSSVFPCPMYYGAKAVALFGQRLAGRTSHAILDEPGVTLSPTRPYRWAFTHRPANSTDQGLLELPIQVTSRLRLPYIGTSLTLFGEVGASWLTRSVVGAPFVNLELHAIDALDANDQLVELAHVQPDLRRPWATKRRIFETVVATLRNAGYSFVTLERAASTLSHT